MKTIVIRFPLTANDFQKVVRILQAGGLVAVPTETVYGLAANALDPKALQKIFEVKGRPQDNPLIVHVGDRWAVRKLVSEIPESAKLLMKKYWPGPLTIVFKKSPKIPDSVSAGLPTIAIRMPRHSLIRRLSQAAGFPLAAPSANVSGRPSSTTPEDILEDLDGKIDCVIDAGGSYYGIESTVIDVSGKIPILLRPGNISIEQLRATLGKVRIARGNSLRPKSPGMKYRHYAPKAKLIVIEGRKENITKKIQSMLNRGRGKKIGVLTVQHPRAYRHDCVKFIGATNNLIARYLFRALREMDRKGIELILAEGIPEKRSGHAIMNRLRKAAGYNVIKV